VLEFLDEREGIRILGGLDDVVGHRERIAVLAGRRARD
jgi:hypothetical protein